ncbi:DUF1146 family protein [Shouchella shacheensis]|uniref:DUF1146 family protein n=1 Tax=Shouchella shacheensis TaxID=1649580 RepID=UPI00073FFDA0|nr:DUF1146 family protein [Shouchella shacheensis]
MTGGFGQDAFVHIVVNVSCIGIAWWALQAFRFDLFVKNPKSRQAVLLKVLVTLALGYMIASFFLDYLYSARMLPYILD